jgi:hypothetical protein
MKILLAEDDRVSRLLLWTKVRSDTDSWQQMEAYVSDHSAVRFSHGGCPECVKTVLQPELNELRRAGASRGNLSP